MINIDLEDLDKFHSALQLSIESEIKIILFNPEGYSLSFAKKPTHDERWFYFERLSTGYWKKVDHKEWRYQFPSETFDIQKLTQFLLLTRLSKENILKIASLDPRFKEYSYKIFKEDSANQTFDNMEEIISFIFSIIEKKKLTIRELSEKTGLSMVSISNFKTGKDIRLSNFLKILKGLELKFSIPSS